MGIPKFYRWLSERYPLIGQSISNIPEIDNLYLDMNGIIHSSSHSNTLGHLIPHLSSASEIQEMLRRAFAYIEMLFQTVKPKKLFYLSLDGVAPRAKMNNQRERRYKFIHEVQEFIAKERKSGKQVVDDWFDSCNISPGTNFMKDLNHYITCFIKWKMVQDENWKKIKVVFSGSNVPGEGEHKIMTYIRNNRNSPDTRHCIYGLDADLILLALITHEPYTIILREEVQIGSFRSLPPRKNMTDLPKFEILFVNILREYLQLEFQCLTGIDLERLIDDFVVLMLFVGNDFIPRLPTFEINEGAVDRLFQLYKKNWSKIGYLSDAGKIIWPALQAFIVEFPKYEFEILSHRIKSSGGRRNETPIMPTTKTLNIKEIISNAKRSEEESKEESHEIHDSAATKSLKETLESYMKRGMEHVKNFYYSFVLGLELENSGDRVQKMAVKYLEGFQWVMNYYFQGVSDWQWYYPFNYAPMISDFVNIQMPDVTFESRPPFWALEQLLGVIPPGSKNLLPSAYAELMEDPDLVNFFPDRPGIEYDPMCAKIGWESLKIKVPFVPYEIIQRKTRNFTEQFENNQVISDLQVEYNPREPVSFVHSLIPSIFPDFDCRVSVTELVYRSETRFLPILTPGTSERLAGFSSLYSVPFKHDLRVVGVSKFQGSSSRESLILEFNQGTLSFKEACDQLYNKSFFFDYPNAEYGLVMGLSSETEVYPKLTAKDLEYYEMTEEQYLQSVRSTLESQLLYAQGIQIRPTLGIVVHYYPLSQIKKTLKGKYTAEWSNSENFAPIELLTHTRLPGHPRDLASPSSLQEEFPVNSRVLLLKKEKQGYLGEVTGYSGPNVQVRVIKKPKPIASTILKLASFHEEKYYSVKEVSHKVHKPIGLINKIMSSIKLKLKSPGKTKILEIGLNLKHDRDYVSVLRWARWGGYWKSSDDWEYSAQALNVLQSYIETFPALWSKLESCWTRNKRTFLVEDLFSYSKPPAREAERAALWVCKQSSYKEPWASLYSEYLCENVVENLSKLALSSKNELADVTETVNPSQIYIPSLPWCPVFSDKILEFKLGHRVMNLNPYFTHFIPFAAEGTVIALLDALHAEVMWDDFIVKNRRIVVPTQNLFNLSTSFIVLKRGNIEKMPFFRANTYTDSSFRPDTFKNKAEESPEQILTRAMSEMRVVDLKLNPNANEFVLPNIESEFEPPSGLEFPVPSFK